MKYLYTIIILYYNFYSLAGVHSTDNSFLLKVDAISLGLQKKTDKYFISNDQSYYASDHAKEMKAEYYPELVNNLTYVLTNFGFIDSGLNWDEYCQYTANQDANKYTGATRKSPVIFRLRYYYSGHRVHEESGYFFFGLSAHDSNTNAPWWKISACSVPPVNPYELRISLPSVIKCIAPYLNKNFKGTITCKR